MSARAFSVALLCALPALAQEEKLPREPGPGEIAPRRAGPSVPERYFPPPVDASQVPAPAMETRRETLPVPDRWRIMQALGLRSSWLDPYNQNVLKGDLPIASEPGFQRRFPALAERLAPDWFVNLGAISDTLVEARRPADARRARSGERPGSVDVLRARPASRRSPDPHRVDRAHQGGHDVQAAGLRGFARRCPVQHQHASSRGGRARCALDSAEGLTRSDGHVGLQERSVDVHLRNVSRALRLRLGARRHPAVHVAISAASSSTTCRSASGSSALRDNNQWQYNLALVPPAREGHQLAG